MTAPTRHRRHLAAPSDTEATGALLARHCPWSDAQPVTLYLRGALGAGKTTLTQGLLRALGITGPVRSPTYALVEYYRAAPYDILHVDLYRLRDATEIESMGLRDELRGRTLLVIEWPEQGGAYIPMPDLTVRLDFEEGGRVAEFEARSSAGTRWLDALGDDTRDQCT